MPELSDVQRLAWLRLVRSTNVGPQTFRLLVNRFGGAEAALDALSGLAGQSGKRRITVCPADDARREIEYGERIGARLVARTEPGYPPLLGHIYDPPPLLWVLGNDAALSQPMVAIVGSRNASGLGRKFTRTLARDLGEAGYTIVSGLARGIDTAAHEASQSTGTIAVYAGGLETPYPAENADLARAIVENGLLVSERPPDATPKGRDFPARNRIISGMARGTVVVEAARRSGSLITARMAGEQNRDVMAVPGSPLDPRAEGTNHLIRDGATMILSARDVIEAVSAGDGGGRNPALPGMGLFEPDHEPITDIPDDAADNILSRLGTATLDIDTLVQESGMSAGAVMGAIMELELAGRVRWSGPMQIEAVFD